MTNVQFKTASNGAVTAGTVSTQVLAENPKRVYALITNDSANVVYLALGEDAVASEGVRLNANGGYFEINYTKRYIGAINAIATAASVVLTVEA